MSWYSPTSLRRITSNGRYVPEIDGLRFIAIVSVMLFHVYMLSRISNGFGPPANRLLAATYFALIHGERGVQVFFAVSGMVLGLPFARQRLLGDPAVRIKPYLLRRLTRLEPPYIANLILRAPLTALVKHLTLGQAATHFAVSLFYADWLFYRATPTIHPPSWSLAVEVQFYLLAPLAAFAIFHENAWLRRTLSVVLIAAFSTLSAHLPMEDTHHFAFRLTLLAFAQFFLVGMLAADIYLTIQPRLQPSFVWDFLGIPLWFALFLVPDSVAYYLAPPALLFLFPAAFLGPLSSAFFRAPFIASVGGMCYSIYLTHSLVLQAVLALLARVVDPHNTAFIFLGAILGPAAALVFATIFFVLIERPCMDKHWPARLRNRLTHRTPVPTP